MAPGGRASCQVVTSALVPRAPRLARTASCKQVYKGLEAQNVSKQGPPPGSLTPTGGPERGDHRAAVAGLSPDVGGGDVWPALPWG